MYRLTCKAFTVEAATLTEVVEKWNRAKHSSAHSYSEIQIELIVKVDESAMPVDGSCIKQLERAIESVKDGRRLTATVGLEVISNWFDIIHRDLRYVRSMLK